MAEALKTSQGVAPEPRASFLTDPFTSRDLFGVCRGRCLQVRGRPRCTARLLIRLLWRSPASLQLVRVQCKRSHRMCEDGCSNSDSRRRRLTASLPAAAPSLLRSAATAANTERPPQTTPSPVAMRQVQWRDRGGSSPCSPVAFGRSLQRRQLPGATFLLAAHPCTVLYAGPAAPRQ